MSRATPTGTVLTGILGAYLVVRGIAEFFLIDATDPSTYRLDWGGPSLLGVLAVHSGPAVLIVGYLAYRTQHNRRVRSTR